MAKSGDLSVTALYTSHTAVWADLPQAQLFTTPEAKRVFDATNTAMAVASVVKRGMSSLRHSVLHRILMIDHLARQAQCAQIVELAAGLSRRGATFTADPRLAYIEIDLPPVIGKKRELLARTGDGRLVAARPGWKLVEGDVETIELAPLVAPHEPVLVIAEGLLMYLAGAARRALFAKVAKLADTTGELRFVFDLTPSNEEAQPGMVGRALEAAMKKFTGGRSFERDAQTRDQICDELRAAGFAAVEVIASTSVAETWKLPHPEQKTQVVVFSAVRTGARA
jgi:O-methyltransferase involved in polyketide biosynthesis